MCISMHLKKFVKNLIIENQLIEKILFLLLFLKIQKLLIKKISKTKLEN